MRYRESMRTRILAVVCGLATLALWSEVSGLNHTSYSLPCNCAGSWRFGMAGRFSTNEWAVWQNCPAHSNTNQAGQYEGVRDSSP